MDNQEKPIVMTGQGDYRRCVYPSHFAKRKDRIRIGNLAIPLILAVVAWGIAGTCIYIVAKIYLKIFE
jgi:hypothetical protein